LTCADKTASYDVKSSYWPGHLHNLTQLCPSLGPGSHQEEARAKAAKQWAHAHGVGANCQPRQGKNLELKTILVA